MQIDGHHALTYIAARFAGLSAKEANIVAYSAQYVDDATNSGVINFNNGAMYKRASSAHKMLDYRNSDELANHRVWIPFHFLPGNGGLEAGQNPDGEFISKLICKPDSPVARDMLKLSVQDKDKPYGLHRLGISMHVYADTFAHQGFAGVNHKINEVTDLESDDSSLDQGFFERVANFFVSNAFPLGHGAALSHPDRPYISWTYTNGSDEVVKRNNQEIFFEAIDKMCRAMKCYMANDSTLNISAFSGIPVEDAGVLKELINSVRADSGEDRHAIWLAEIANGRFSFGAEEISYVPKGEGSWKHQSIGQLKSEDQDDDEFKYSNDFLSSDWKLFHDALQAYRFDILHDVLPKYGICAA